MSDDLEKTASSKRRTDASVNNVLSQGCRIRVTDSTTHDDSQEMRVCGAGCRSVAPLPIAAVTSARCWSKQGIARRQRIQAVDQQFWMGTDVTDDV